MKLSDSIQSLKKKYIPMNQSVFYILLILEKPVHGYGIAMTLKSITNEKVFISHATMYTNLSRLKNDELIVEVGRNKNKIIYQITDLGRIIFSFEKERVFEMWTLIKN